MNTKIIAFTKKGSLVAIKLKENIPESSFAQGYGENKVSLSTWTKEAFESADLIIFVSAVGIAVRAISQYIKSKVEDPAVVVVDDNGKYAIPILSGHLGGANDYALMISKIIGSQTIITTSTDINGVWAVDTWAKKQGLKITNPEKIKCVSSKLIAGDKVYIYPENFEILGELPENVLLVESAENADIVVSVFNETNALALVPEIVSIGIGCRKNVSFEAVETLFIKTLEENNININSVKGIFSIDIKKNEKAIIALCEKYNLSFSTFTAEELKNADGNFSHSDFVKNTVGVDNVCERSAVSGSNNGKLLIKKTSLNGVTIAAAVDSYSIKF